jgi:hypothetical protein
MLEQNQLNQEQVGRVKKIMSKSNKIENINNLQECVDYILDNRSGWSQFTSWYVEKHGANRKYANLVWNEAWKIITDDFEDSVKQSVNETLLKLERLEEEAIAENDRRIWLEVIKYRNKIRGGEIERSEVKVTGNIQLNWGNDPGLQKLESNDDNWQKKM